MNQEQEIEDEITTEQAMLKLNYWQQQMELVQPNQEQCFREYIALYVEKQSYSEDFFIALCEHAVIQRLFGAAGKQVPTIAVLEMFNLLLANTSQLNNLVYIFSQPSLHEYLFDRFNIFKENAESVEYYIQLLKTIIMKISIHKNNSLIKLFCNNRYPSFPLLTMVTLLGTSLTREVLVKVTAHQCVLLLIALINQKEVGRGYLNDLQMIVFYFEFANQLFEEEKADQQGMLKYLVDLIFALRNNFTSLSFLLNTICNVLIARTLNLNKIIAFLSKLSEQIRQYEKFPTQLSHQIMNNFASIVNKIYFAAFINSTYMTTLKLVPSLKAQCQPNLLKYFNQRGDKISAYLIEFDKQPETQKEKEYAFEGWRDFNDSSQEVINIKQNKPKPKSSIFGFFMGKIDPNEQYIKVVLMTAGLNYQQVRFPLFKLSLSLNYKTALYIVEQMLSKHNPHRGTSHPHSKIQTFEIHINQFRGKFDLTLELLKEIFRMREKLDDRNVSLTNEEKSAAIKGIQFQFHFLKHLRTYFIHNLCDHLLNADQDYKISQMVLWSTLLARLQVNDYLERKCRQKLFYRMQKLQQEIHELTFQNDFKYLIEYIIYNKEKRFLMSKFTLEEDELNCKEAVLQNRLDRKIFKYEVLRKLMDSQQPSINEFIQAKWGEVIVKGQYKIVHLDEKDSQIEVTATANEGFVIKLIKNQQDTIQFSLNEMDGQIEEEDPSRIYFVRYPNGIKMRSQQSALNLCNQIKKMRSKKEEIITKSILQYFQTVHQSLCKKVYHKMGEKSDKITILNAH